MHSAIEYCLCRPLILAVISKKAWRGEFVLVQRIWKLTMLVGMEMAA